MVGYEVEIKAMKRPFEGALALVIGEHVDKLSFYEPNLTVVEKEVTLESVRFLFMVDGKLTKTIEEIIRGYKIGVFKIAREYGLVSKSDREPIFASSFTIRMLE